jgi:hypothetical protein
MKENTEERISKPHKTQRTLGKHSTTKHNKTNKKPLYQQHQQQQQQQCK